VASPATAAEPPKDSATVLSTYARILTDAEKAHSDFLSEQTKQHHEYWKEAFDRMLSLGAWLIALFIAVIGFFGWKHRDDIEKLFRERTAGLIDDKMESLRASTALVEERNKQLEERNKQLLAQVVELENRVTKDVNLVIDLTSALSLSVVLLEDTRGVVKEEFDEVIKLLKGVVEKLPSHRQSVIFLARFYRKLGQFSDACTVLEVALEKGGGGLAAEDKAAFLYNQACYLNLLSRQASGDEKRCLAGRARQALKASGDAYGQNLEDAKTDPDLSDLQGSGPANGP
jgi:hypothetical protein